MNNLYHLTSEDFFLENGAKGKVLCMEAKGLVLVCFHANPDRCQHCEDTLPHFKRLPQRVGNCKFALVNLNANPDVVKMSKLSIAPIEYVPFIILYVNGRPFLNYTGERTVQDMTEFIQEVVQKLQSKQSFIEQKNYKIESEIPAYSIGIPYSVVCDEDKGVCYLDWNTAYNNKNPQQGQPRQQGPPRQQQGHYPQGAPQMPPQQYYQQQQQGQESYF